MAPGLVASAVLAVLFALTVAAPTSARSPAVCGAGDRPEPGLQGQVPLEAQGDDSRKGFWCGVRLVGRSDIENRGANYNLAWSGDCAYVSSIFAGSESEPAGVAVIDVAGPTSPRVTTVLTTPGAAAAVETIHAADAPDGRRILVAGRYDAEPTGDLDVFDVTDCAEPKLMTTFETSAPMHNVTLSRDGRTLYVATGTTTGPHLVVLDLSDMTAPREIATLDLATLAPQGFRPGPFGLHRVDLNGDGTRAYAGVASASLFLPVIKPAFQGGEVLVLDTTDIAQRKPEPRIRMLSQFQNGWHGPRWFRVGGRSYVVGGDEMSPAAAGHGSCEGVWPYIGDVTDPRAPKPVGEFRMEIQQTVNCPEAMRDELLYATHYSDIDDPDDAALGLFPMYNSGLRVADLRDPSDPREVGYFNPPPDLDTQFGSTLGPKPDRVDLVGSNVRYHARTGHIWFVSMTGGFWVVELASTGPAKDLGLPAGPAAPPASTRSPRCIRTLKINVRAPRGQRLRSARIFVNGRRVRSLRGRDLRVPVTLRRLPAGRIRVKIVARTRTGRTLTRTRRYIGCRR